MLLRRAAGLPARLQPLQFLVWSGLALHRADVSVERQRLLIGRPRRIVIPARQRDIAEAREQLASPCTEPTFGAAAAPARGLAGGDVIQATKRDIAEAQDAVGLALHGADVTVERQRLLIRALRPRRDRSVSAQYRPRHS